jgi:hypothetical protein
MNGGEVASLGECNPVSKYYNLKYAMRKGTMLLSSRGKLKQPLMNRLRLLANLLAQLLSLKNPKYKKSIPGFPEL